MVDGFRYGFFGQSDVPPAISLAVVAATLALAAGVALRMLQTGWRIRHCPAAGAARRLPVPHPAPSVPSVRRTVLPSPP
jgi:hypothetical protein